MSAVAAPPRPVERVAPLPPPRTDERPERRSHAPATAFSIVCLSSEDWDATLPTNRQQIMRRAAAAGHEVVFVETGRFLGKHLVALATGSAGPRRTLWRRLRGGDRVEQRITVRRAPNPAPLGQRSALANRLNAAATALLVRRIARRLPQPVAVWLYDPVAAAAVPRLRGIPVAYDCVDDYVEQVGADERRRAVVAAGDELAARSAAVVFATSRAMLERQQRRNPNTHLVRNVGDFAHFAPAADRRLVPPGLAGLPRPVLGFAGNFLAGKVDLDVLDRLARARPQWTLLLAGPGHPETEERVTALAALPNVHRLGAIPYAELPCVVAAFDVGLIPYVESAYTRSCFPLKLFELLAAGKPVVATGLPELDGMEPDVVRARRAEDVIASVEAALLLLSPEDAARRQAVAAANTWETRAGTQLRLVGELLAARAGAGAGPGSGAARGR